MIINAIHFHRIELTASSIKAMLINSSAGEQVYFLQMGMALCAEKAEGEKCSAQEDSSLSLHHTECADLKISSFGVSNKN